MRRFIVLTLFALAFLSVLPARAAEEILNYASRIEVRTDGVLDVTETIIVRAEGDRIRRGIFRDFPLRFRDTNGEISRVSFNVDSVTRDGKRETWSTESNSNFVRLRIGNPEVMLTRGEHTYEIRFTTDRQIRFFDDHDELYWNAVGTEWEFPVLQASTIVVLPNGAKATELTVFTGALGEKEKNARAQLSAGGNEATFTTTQPLGPREGMTIVAAFPKNVVAAPTVWQTIRWYIRDHLGSVFAIGGLLFAGIYYLRSWLKVGVDPKGGTIVPRWDMPDGVSPALVHYIDNKGYNRDPWRPISASVLSLAVKGRVKLDDLKSDMVVQSTGVGAAGKLPTGEAQVMRQVEAAGGTLRFNKTNGTRIAAMQSAFSSAMESEHRSNYYKANTLYIVFGVFISIVVFVATLAVADMDETGFVALFGLVVAGVIATILITRWAKARATSLWGKIKLIIGTAIASFVIISIAGMVLASVTGTETSPLVFGGLAALVMLNLLFFFLMGAPTPLGRGRMDEIEGLKRYLTVAEEDRMNMAGAPEMSPKHYEKLLPFAVALNLEKPWSNAFQGWLTAAIAAGTVAATTYYGPGWYTGSGGFSPDHIGDSMGDLAGSMESSMTNSLPVPESSSSGFGGGSSGGGGGFSGGGGGGGGGGGW